MKTLIIYKSIHHGNTKKIVDVMAPILESEKKEASEISKDFNFNNYDLIIFASGIYAFKHHKEILKIVKNAKGLKGKKVVIISTSGDGSIKQHKRLRSDLINQRAEIVDEFSCKGFSDWGPTKFFGGSNKGRPNEEDLKKAENFASKFKKQSN